MTFLKNIPADEVTDKQLVAAYKESGDMSFISTLYQRYMDLVFGVCLKYFKDVERSKDAVMDIFEELSAKLKQHDVENFKGWLGVLSRNHCLMKLRSPRNIKTAEFNADFMQSVQNDHLENEALEKEESLVKLEDCLQQLTADQQQSIQLFFMQKKSYNEIAEITGHEWNQVRSFIQNGKRNLKLCLDQNTIG